MDISVNEQFSPRKRNMTFPMNNQETIQSEKESIECLLNKIKQTLLLSDKAIKDFKQLIDSHYSSQNNKELIYQDPSLIHTLKAFFSVRGIKSFSEEKLKDCIRLYVNHKVELEKMHSRRYSDKYFSPQKHLDLLNESSENEIDEIMNKTQNNSFNAEISEDWRYSDEKNSFENEENEETFTEFNRNCLISILKTQINSRDSELNNVKRAYENEIKKKEDEANEMRAKIEEFEKKIQSGDLVDLQNIRDEIRYNEKSWIEKMIKQEAELKSLQIELKKVQNELDVNMQNIQKNTNDITSFTGENARLEKNLNGDLNLDNKIRLKEQENSWLKEDINRLVEDKERLLMQMNYMNRNIEFMKDCLDSNVRLFKERDEIRDKILSQAVYKQQQVFIDKTRRNYLIENRIAFPKKENYNFTFWALFIFVALLAFYPLYYSFVITEIQ